MCIRDSVLTGITTSGTPHLGNYVGAGRPAVAASRAPDTESFYFLADLHSPVSYTHLIQAKWGDLTDDDFKVAEGNAEYLTGKLQERYGYDRDRAHTEVEDFKRTLRSDSSFKH